MAVAKSTPNRSDIGRNKLRTINSRRKSNMKEDDQGPYSDNPRFIRSGRTSDFVAYRRDNAYDRNNGSSFQANLIRGRRFPEDGARQIFEAETEALEMNGPCQLLDEGMRDDGLATSSRRRRHCDWGCASRRRRPASIVIFIIGANRIW
jgi:hypothetical protein